MVGGREGLVRLLQSAPFVVLTAAVIGAPLVLLLLYSFRETSFLGVEEGYTLANYRDVWSDDLALRLFWRTGILALVVAAIVTVLAFVLAYGLTFRLRGRSGQIVLVVIISAGIASLLVRIYAWGTILGTNGVVNQAVQSIGLTDEPLGFLFFGYFAIALTMTYIFLPIAALITFSAMQEIDPRSLEASRDLGTGRWRTAGRVVLPQVRSSLAAAFVLTALVSAADYVTPSLVGGLKGKTIAGLVRGRALESGDLGLAAATAISFMVLLTVALAGVMVLLRLSRPVLQNLGRWADRPARAMTSHVPAGVASRSLSKVAALVLAVYLVAPTILVVVFSFNSGQLLGLPFQGFTFDWYPRVIDTAGVTDSVWTSARITAAAVVFGIILGVPSAFALKKAQRIGETAIYACVFAPVVIPGILIGIAVLIAATDRGFALGLSTTIPIHVLIVAGIVVLIVRARLENMDPQLFEAARDLGSSPARVLRTITFPIILPAVMGAALVGAAYSLDEVFITNFSVGTNTTVPIWMLSQARRGFSPAINALGVMLLIGTALIFGLALRILGRLLHGGRRDAG